MAGMNQSTESREVAHLHVSSLLRLVEERVHLKLAREVLEAAKCKALGGTVGDDAEDIVQVDKVLADVRDDKRRLRGDTVVHLEHTFFVNGKRPGMGTGDVTVLEAELCRLGVDGAVAAGTLGGIGPVPVGWWWRGIDVPLWEGRILIVGIVILGVVAEPLEGHGHVLVTEAEASLKGLEERGKLVGWLLVWVKSRAWRDWLVIGQGAVGAGVGCAALGPVLFFYLGAALNLAVAVHSDLLVEDFSLLCSQKSHRALQVSRASQSWMTNHKHASIKYLVHILAPCGSSAVASQFRPGRADTH